MAPSANSQDVSLAPHTVEQVTPPVAKRLIAESTLISIIIPLVILTILTTATASFFVRRAWNKRQESKLEKAAEAPTPPPLAERRQSNWARQNSNVLWSMYINDDDLRAQFSKPSKDSRLFSIGSVSSVGPMDTTTARPSVVIEHDEKPAALNKATQPRGSTLEKVLPSKPRRATCDSVEKQDVSGKAWLGGLGRRRTSVTAV